MTAALLAMCVVVFAAWMGREAAWRHRLGLARRDPVTGLATRNLWTRRAQRILRYGGHHHVIFLDLDKFKPVNDGHGHMVGDQVLAAAASRIGAWTASAGGGACGRFGGDEFVVVTRRAITGRKLADLGERLAMPVTLAARTGTPVITTTRASIGAAPCGGPAQLSAAMTAADKAMYEAKRAGGGWRFSSSPAGTGGGEPRRRPHRTRSGRGGSAAGRPA